MKVGILGAGQLGRMLALAGYRLGWEFRVYDARPNTAMKVVPESVTAEFSDRNALDQFAEGLDLVTYEFENVPAEALEYLQNKVSTYPQAKALRTAHDRLLEKELFNSLDVPTTRFAKADSEKELEDAFAAVGFPCVVKARRMGYDGKGQKVLTESREARSIWSELGEVPLLVENLVPFEREVSQVIARSRSGEVACYPLTENHHKVGILRWSLATATSSDPVAEQAAESAKRIAERLDFVGVMAVEFFQSSNALIANEIAPRVHNSGHWTQDAPVTSQFENHLRGIADLPLGPTQLPNKNYYGMWNWVGQVPPLKELAQREDLKLHLYDKAPRPGRKIAHTNFQGPDRQSVDKTVSYLKGLAESLPIQ